MVRAPRKVMIEAKAVGKNFALRPTKKHRWRKDGHIREFTALKNVNLDIYEGEIVVLVGPSGCGKTTFLHMVAGLESISSGRICIGGIPISGPGLDRAVVFQQYALLPWKSALGNIEFVLEVNNIPKKERCETAQHFLRLVGLEGFSDRYPHELSGGMCQRVALARSLASNPDILLMDEPFAALDAQTRELLQDELLDLWGKTGKTIVFITHSIEEAVYLGQRVAIMTSKPGTIKLIIDVDLPDDRLAVDDLRSDPHFSNIRHEVWALLRDEVIKAQNEDYGVNSKKVFGAQATQKENIT